jgi:outer membrane autotransporter protein
VRNAATDRVQQAFCAVGGTNSNIKTRTADAQPATSSCNPDRIVVWTRAFGSWGHTNSDGNAATMNTSIGGAFFGADARVFDSWRVGMLAGYSHSDFTVDERNSSGSSNNYDLGVYGGTQWGNLGLRMGMAYTWHNIDTSRSVSFSGYTDQLGASYHAGTFQLFGDLGYRINAGPVGVEPFVSLAYVHLSTDGFTEQGGAAALTSGSESDNSTFSTLGVRAASTFAAGNLDLTAKGMLGWRHAWGNVTPASMLAFSGGNAFTVAGVPIARDVAVIEAGLEAPIGRNGTVGVSYVGQMGSGMQHNGVRGDLSWKF